MCMYSNENNYQYKRPTHFHFLQQNETMTMVSYYYVFLMTAICCCCFTMPTTSWTTVFAATTTTSWSSHNHHEYVYSRNSTTAASMIRRQFPSRLPFTGVDVVSVLSSTTAANSDGKRRLDEEVSGGGGVNGTSGCGICGEWSNVLVDTFPEYNLPSEEVPEGLSCKDWEWIAGNLMSPISMDCDFVHSFLLPQCCNITSSPNGTNVASYQCETAVHDALLGGASYDATVTPVPAGSQYINVSVSMDYFQLTSLSTTEGTAEIFFGISMNWIDERLKWDPSEFGGCHRTTFRASLDVEKTEIWVPDYDLLNRVHGVADFKDAMAGVSANGLVSWYRLGGLKALCVFTGLEQFPYDELGCYLTMGTIGYPNINYILADGGLQFPGTHVANYQEFKVMEDRSFVFTRDEGFPIYQFYFDRASRFYTQTIVVPTILFTLLSFGTFLLDVRVGERLAFGVSILLVIVAQAIVTTGNLPICSERLWVTTLTTSSQYYVLASIMESLLVAYLFFVETKEINERKEAEEREAEATAAGTASDAAAKDENSMAKDEEVHSSTSNVPVHSKGPTASMMRRFLHYELPQFWRRKVIRQMDFVCVIFFPISYTVFFSVMLALRDNW